MDRVIDFNLVLRCSEKQLKLCRRQLQVLSADAGIPIIWKESTEQEDAAFITGTLPITYHTQFIELVMDKYKRRYIRTEIYLPENVSKKMAKSYKDLQITDSQVNRNKSIDISSITQPVTKKNENKSKIYTTSQTNGDTIILEHTSQDASTVLDVGSFTPKPRIRRSVRRRYVGKQ